MPLSTHGGLSLSIPGARPSTLVLLKPGRDGSSLFIVPGRNDDARVLIDFSKKIRFAGSVFGLQPRGLDGHEVPYDAIEEIAEGFVQAILDVQPVGSYSVIGVSLGGLVAFEAAHQLNRIGKSVAFLGLLDTYPDPRFWPLRCWLAVLARRVQHHVTNVLRLSAGEMLPYAAKVAESFMDHFRSRLGKKPKLIWSKGTIDGSETLKRLEECNVRALSCYKPSRYPGTITFVQAKGVDVGGRKLPGNPAAVWKGLCDTIELHVVQSDHRAMVRADGDEVASILSHLLKEHIVPLSEK